MRMILGFDVRNDSAITVAALDAPGPGGANHLYEIAGVGSNFQHRAASLNAILIPFQKGPVPKGINGLTNEILLAIVIDRLRSFQEGPFECPENADALALAEEALETLKKRTRDRMARGVEGTMQK